MDPQIQIRIHTKMSWIRPQHWLLAHKIFVAKICITDSKVLYGAARIVSDLALRIRIQYELNFGQN
jgi:hypothetical protein